MLALRYVVDMEVKNMSKGCKHLLILYGQKMLKISVGLEEVLFNKYIPSMLKLCLRDGSIDAMLKIFL